MNRLRVRNLLQSICDQTILISIIESSPKNMLGSPRDLTSHLIEEFLHRHIFSSTDLLNRTIPRGFGFGLSRCDNVGTGSFRIPFRLGNDLSDLILR